MSAPTKQELRAGLAVTIAVSETIRELGQVPSGTIYAGILDRVSFEGYQKLLAVLKGAGLISISPDHMIRWTGPELEASRG